MSWDLVLAGMNLIDFMVQFLVNKLAFRCGMPLTFSQILCICLLIEYFKVSDPAQILKEVIS